MIARGLSAQAVVIVALMVGACASSSANVGTPLDCSSVKSPADGLSNGTCSKCLKSTCCHEGSVCAANKECLALTQCWNACSDGVCNANCESSHAAGKSDFLAFRTCSSSGCTYKFSGADVQCSFSF